MYYIIEDEDDYQRKLKVNHENNETELTLSVCYGDENNFENYKCCLIDLDKKQLHDFIGVLLHIQQKMKGTK